MPALYIVATPIGNLEDISLRALRTLCEVKLIAAEDTRRTRHLLTTYGIETPLTSYHKHSRRAKLAYLLRCLEEKDVALVSEAGMPGLADPGYELLTAAQERGVPVKAVPGPTAIGAALSVAGIFISPICVPRIPATVGRRAAHAVELDGREPPCPGGLRIAPPPARHVG